VSEVSEVSEVTCFDLACPNGRKQLTRYRPGLDGYRELNGYRELPFMSSAGRKTAVRLNCAEHKAQMLCEKHKAQGGLAQPKLVGKRRATSHPEHKAPQSRERNSRKSEFRSDTYRTEEVSYIFSIFFQGTCASGRRWFQRGEVVVANTLTPRS
jgi:hypothetical protein